MRGTVVEAGPFGRVGRGEPTDYVTSTAGALLLDTMGGIESEAPFVARHDPARALREVEAGRQLLSDYEEAKASEGVTAGVITQILLMQIINRVRVYSDHPDYDPNWKP